MKHRFGYLLVAVTLFSACNKEIVLSEQPTPQEPQEIKINAYLQEGNRVRPLTRTVGGNLANGYILYGAWTNGPYLDPTAQSTAKYFIQNRKMNADGTTADGTKLFWNTDGTTCQSFFAYSANPPGTTSGCGVTYVKTKFFASVPYGISFDFRQENDPAKHIDLLVADKLDIQTIDGVPSAVNLYFRHRLSKVSVQVFGSGGVNLTDCQAKITYNSSPLAGRECSVNGIETGFLLTMQNDGYIQPTSFSNGYFPRNQYNLGGNFTVPGSAVTEKDAVPVGDMILIPENTYGEGNFILELSYKPDGSPTPVTVTTPLPELKLKSMMQYVITLNILETTQSLSVSSVQLTDWTTTSGTIDQL